MFCVLDLVAVGNSWLAWWINGWLEGGWVRGVHNCSLPSRSHSADLWIMGNSDGSTLKHEASCGDIHSFSLAALTHVGVGWGGVSGQMHHYRHTVFSNLLCPLCAGCPWASV